MDSVLTGGSKTITNKDIFEMEEKKIKELKEEFRARGEQIPDLGDAKMIDEGDGIDFEAFQ
jgi:hypothetical protein